MYHKLLKKIEYAKRSNSLPQLYEAKGAIDLAYKVEIISREQYLDLDSRCVRDGINNPEIINHPNNK